MDKFLDEEEIERVYKRWKEANSDNMLVWDDEIPVGMTPQSTIDAQNRELIDMREALRRAHDAAYTWAVATGIIGLIIGYGLSYV